MDRSELVAIIALQTKMEQVSKELEVTKKRVTELENQSMGKLTKEERAAVRKYADEHRDEIRNVSKKQKRTIYRDNGNRLANNLNISSPLKTMRLRAALKRRVTNPEVNHFIIIQTIPLVSL